MKTMLKVGAFAAAGCALLSGCGGPELTEAQEAVVLPWQDDAEILVEVEDPDMRALSQSGIPAVDVVADSITALSQFTTGAVAAYMLESDARACWSSYSKWATDAEAGKYWGEINALEEGAEGRKEKIAEYLKIAELESRYRSFPTVLKRTADEATFEAKFNAMCQYVTAKDPEGKNVASGGERDWTKAVVDANYAPIIVMEPKTVTVTVKDGDKTVSETRTVYRTVSGAEVYADNEEGLATFAVKSALNAALTRTDHGATANAAGKVLGVDLAAETAEKPLTFTYLDGKVPTRLPNVAAKIPQTDANGAIVKDAAGQTVMTDNPAFAALVAQWKKTPESVVFYDATGKTVQADDAAVGAYETFVDANGAFIRSYVSQKGLYDVDSKTFKTDKAYTGADGYINTKDALVLDELTQRPAKVKVAVKKDLAKLLVKNYEGLRPLQKAIQDAKTDEERQAAEAAFDAAAKKAEENFLSAMAVEEIDWEALALTLTTKIAQATADAAQLQQAMASNAKVIAMLSFGQKVAEDISVDQTKAALERIGKQSVLNVKLLPYLAGLLTDQLTEKE